MTYVHWEWHSLIKQAYHLRRNSDDSTRSFAFQAYTQGSLSWLRIHRNVSRHITSSQCNAHVLRCLNLCEKLVGFATCIVHRHNDVSFVHLHVSVCCVPNLDQSLSQGVNFRHKQPIHP